MEIGEIKKKFFTDNVILAAIPILAYYSAFQYQRSYLRAFGAPEDLISVDIYTLVVFGSAIFGLGIILYNTLSFVWTYGIVNLYKLSWKKSVIVSVGSSIILWLLFFTIYSFDWYTPTIISSSFLLLFVFSYLNSLWKVIPQWLFTALFGVILITSISLGIGQREAKYKSRYTVITSLKNTFVICKTGDYFLCSTYDSSSHTFTKTFRLLPIKDNGLELEYREIGPLQMLK
ncbi:MAG: hypothetical protein P4L35_02020 [Ignavibacteriaceae bacterium]|nr:hypothetical protein [Ignavibacteriaceae bacterium]